MGAYSSSVSWCKLEQLRTCSHMVMGGRQQCWSCHADDGTIKDKFILLSLSQILQQLLCFLTLLSWLSDSVVFTGLSGATGELI